MQGREERYWSAHFNFELEQKVRISRSAHPPIVVTYLALLPTAAVMNHTSLHRYDIFRKRLVATVIHDT